MVFEIRELKLKKMKNNYNKENCPFPVIRLWSFFEDPILGVLMDSGLVVYCQGNTDFRMYGSDAAIHKEAKIVHNNYLV